jgi:tRNA dimethylallyltransferase
MFLAERLDGVIVNADSMQLYRELSIVTARPSAADTERVPHHLYGILPAAEPFSTGQWLRLVDRELARLLDAGKVPVFVGGTGLYFKALTEGFAELPEIDAVTRSECRKVAETGGVEAVRAALKPLDPEAADTLQDLQRLTRALEVVQATGRTLAHWQREAQGAPLLPAERTVRLVLAPPRPWLHERIAVRARAMLVEGGVEEVRELLALGLPGTLPAMRAIGVKEIASLLAGEIDRAEAERQLTVATRQYAKRQETWFRNQMSDWLRVDPSEEPPEGIAKRIARDWTE